MFVPGITGRFATPTFYETPGGVGQGAAPVAQPPSAGGQGNGGQGQPTAADGFNWGLFPNVPEAQRPLLQPHLKDVLGHVTRIEQQYAPFKQYIDSGLTPDELGGLLGFSERFDQDPAGTLAAMVQGLAEQGALPETFDPEAFQQMLSGQQDSNGYDPNGYDPNGGGELDPNNPLAQMVMQLQQQIQQMQDGLQANQQSQQQAQEDALLDQAITDMKGKLQEAGIDVSKVADADQLITGAILSANGDPERAFGQLTGFRDATVGQTIDQAQNGSTELTLPKGPPPAAPRNAPRDSWESARTGASQFLAAASAAEAQGG